MEVILLEKIRNLGKLGDQVKVKPGYARNYLLPYGHAVVANEQNKSEFEARRAELEKTQADALGAAQARASGLSNVRVEITGRASEEGKLFGSVGTREIADALAALGHEVNRSEVLLPSGALKELGEYEVTVTLHPEVNVTITVAIAVES